MPPVLALLRPRQWYKNTLVFVPLVFSGNACNTALWSPALLCFIAFCALSSSTYCVNDVLDAKRDRLHPVKRDRPVASGRIKAPAALLLAFFLGVAGLSGLWLINLFTFALGVSYLVLQAAYNLMLKQMLIWDALAVAAGFVVRALAGTTAIDVGPPTEWLIVCTFLFALYLALAKRRHELVSVRAGDTAAAHRPALAGYDVAFVDQIMQTSATLLLAAYSLYTFFGTDRWMMFTLPFAFYGVFRHAWLVHHRALGDEAEMLFRDRATLINGALWLLVILAVQAGWPDAAVAALEGLA